MSDAEQWRPVARRGELFIFVVTRANLVASGCQSALPEGQRLLVILDPDDGERRAMAVQSLLTLAGYVREMAPREIVWVVAPGEDALAMNATLAELVAAPAAETH